MIAPDPEQHVHWPAERFYWGVLDGTLLPRGARAGGRALNEGLGYLFEAVLPGVPIEQVHAVYTPIPGSGRRYLACGAPRALLEEAIEPDALTLTPQALPPFLAEQGEPLRLNLLTGEFLPRTLRRRTRRALLHAAILGVVCTALAVTGFERRVGAIEDQTAGFVAMQEALYRDILGAEALASGSGGQPAHLKLLGERRRLERTRNSDAAPIEVVDCARLLTDVMALWPRDVNAETETVNVRAESITIRAVVPAMTDAQRFADAFGSLEGWQLLQPQSETQRGRVLVMVRLQRETSP